MDPLPRESPSEKQKKSGFKHAGVSQSFTTLMAAMPNPKNDILSTVGINDSKLHLVKIFFFQASFWGEIVGPLAELIINILQPVFKSLPSSSPWLAFRRKPPEKFSKEAKTWPSSHPLASSIRRSKTFKLFCHPEISPQKREGSSNCLLSRFPPYPTGPLIFISSRRCSPIFIARERRRKSRENNSRKMRHVAETASFKQEKEPFFFV